MPKSKPCAAIFGKFLLLNAAKRLVLSLFVFCTVGTCGFDAPVRAVCLPPCRAVGSPAGCRNNRPHPAAALLPACTPPRVPLAPCFPAVSSLPPAPRASWLFSYIFAANAAPFSRTMHNILLFYLLRIS